MNIQLQFGVFFVCKFLCMGMLFLTLISRAGMDIESTDMTGIFTAYTAMMSQTDSTPEITASNQKVREGIVANNCLPFGTKIKVNNKVFEVQDRMNRRYGCDAFDIYMLDYAEAIDFGRKRLTYEHMS